MHPVVAQRNIHRRIRPSLPRRFRKPKYRQQNMVERCYSWLKELRRISTRYDKLMSSFNTMVCVLNP
jgi:transposase